MGRLARISGRHKVPGGLLLLALLFHSVQAFTATVPTGQSVTLAWNPSPAANATGYNIYYGVASGTYTSMINVGTATNATIPGLVAGVTYYFAATTYNASGEQGAFSSETTYAVPTSARLHLRSASAGQFTLTVTGLIGHTYQILSSSDLTTWTVIGTVTVGTGGSLDFTDTTAASFPRRFYRTLDTQP